MDTLRASIWFEKYRPTTFDEMVLPDEQRSMFNQMVASQDFPHLLLYGHQGTGKTTISKILTTLIPCSTLVLNASGADRGVDTMRTTVVQFAASMPPKGKRFKAIILDEADFLTPEAQGALRNTIETYSASCRFILTANNVDKIIGPLRSRCTGIEMAPFSEEYVTDLCSRILEKENIQGDAGIVSRIVSAAYPDIRKIINNLQRCAIGGRLDPKAILPATSVTVGAIYKHIENGNLRAIRELVHGRDDFVGFYKGMFNELEQLIPNDADKIEAMANTICTHLFYEPTIPDRELNFAACCATLMVQCGKHKKITF